MITNVLTPKEVVIIPVSIQMEATTALVILRITYNLTISHVSVSVYTLFILIKLYPIFRTTKFDRRTSSTFIP